MPARRRNIVVRSDGRPVNVARPRGQLFVCATGCCCGRTEDGFAAVPAELYHDEWERRRLRNVVHLTIGGCLGPCALANVVLLPPRRRGAVVPRPRHRLADPRALRSHRDHAGGGPPPASAASPGSAPVHGLGLAVAAGRAAGRRSPALAARSTTRGPDLGALPGRRRGTRHCRPGCAAPRAAREPPAGGRASPERRARLRRALARAHLRHGDRAVRAGRGPWEEFRQALIEAVAAAEAREASSTTTRPGSPRSSAFSPRTAWSRPASSRKPPTSSSSANATTSSDAAGLPAVFPPPRRWRGHCPLAHQPGKLMHFRLLR